MLRPGRFAGPLPFLIGSRGPPGSTSVAANDCNRGDAATDSRAGTVARTKAAPGPVILKTPTVPSSLWACHEL